SGPRARCHTRPRAALRTRSAVPHIGRRPRLAERLGDRSDHRLPPARRETPRRRSASAPARARIRPEHLALRAAPALRRCPAPQPATRGKNSILAAGDTAAGTAADTGFPRATGLLVGPRLSSLRVVRKLKSPRERAF